MNKTIKRIARTSVIFAVILVSGQASFVLEAGQRGSWFGEAQYGLFIHWGCYAVPAKGEWFLNASGMDPLQYAQYADEFKAEKYDPKNWAAKAKGWGMKYVVFTTRHHDGYAMWDSKVNPWNCMTTGPKRDILGELVPAFRAEGIKIGYYYSPANWSNPDYAGYRIKGWPRGANPWKSEDARKRFVAYYKSELAELLDKYGPPDYLWWDGCMPGGLEGGSLLNELGRKYPQMIWTDRMGAPFDVRCCEQEIRRPGGDGAWEACMTLNGSWGYNKGDSSWKNMGQVMDMLIQCQRDGGNLLLNVGPMANGLIPEASVKVLDEVGAYLNREGVRDALLTYRNALTYEGDMKPHRRLFARAEAGAELKIAVLGGSITEGTGARCVENRWANRFAAGWQDLFPKAKVVLRNAGIGATGSEIGAYRYGKDVSPFKPDLVVFEFGVNDSGEKSAGKTLAGLLRHAARDGSAAIVLSMAREDGKDAQTEHLKAAKEYHVPVISYKDAVTPMLKSGAWKWSDIAADGVHPNDRGHGIAAGLLNIFIRDEYRMFRKDRESRPFLPAPAVTQPYEKGSLTSFAGVKLDECVGFIPYDEDRLGKGLMATNVGARVSFTFEGGTASFLYRKGKLPHGRVRVTVDGTSLAATPDGYGDNWWWWTPKQQLVTDCPGRHSVVIETIGRGPSKSEGDGFRLAALLVGP